MKLSYIAIAAALTLFTTPAFAAGGGVDRVVEDGPGCSDCAGNNRPDDKRGRPAHANGIGGANGGKKDVREAIGKTPDRVYEPDRVYQPDHVEPEKKPDRVYQPDDPENETGTETETKTHVDPVPTFSTGAGDPNVRADQCDRPRTSIPGLSWLHRTFCPVPRPQARPKQSPKSTIRFEGNVTRDGVGNGLD